MPKGTKTPNLFIGLFTEDGLDQITYSLRDANREAKDLRAMGFTVKVVACKGPMSEDYLDHIAAVMKGKPQGIPGKATITGLLKIYPDVAPIEARI